MSEPRTRYDTGPLRPQQREAIRHALQSAIDRLQDVKDSIDEPRPITGSDCDALLTQVQAARLAMDRARDLLE